jgi:hypothetical protein
MSKILLKVLLIVSIVVVAKMLVVDMDLNILATGSILNSLIAGTIFIFGVILSAVFSEYREVDKIPGELANHLESLFEDVESLENKNEYDHKKLEYKSYLKKLYEDLTSWNKKIIPSRQVFQDIESFSVFIKSLEKNLPANYVVRMRNELFHIRRIFIRLDHARDVGVSFFLEGTSLIFSISTIFTMMCTKFENDLTGVWTIALLTVFFSSIYLIIKVLDNPFENNLVNFKSIKILEENL